MENTQKKISVRFTILAVISLIIGFVLINGNYNKPDIAKSIKVDPMVLMIKPGESDMTVKELEDIVMKMPDSALKSCLLTCIGAAYGGDIDQLHIIMKEFARLKILELKLKNQI